MGVPSAHRVGTRQRQEPLSWAPCARPTNSSRRKARAAPCAHAPRRRMAMRRARPWPCRIRAHGGAHAACSVGMWACTVGARVCSNNLHRVFSMNSRRGWSRPTKTHAARGLRARPTQTLGHAARGHTTADACRAWNSARKPHTRPKGMAHGGHGRGTITSQLFLSCTVGVRVQASATGMRRAPHTRPTAVSWTFGARPTHARRCFARAAPLRTRTPQTHGHAACHNRNFSTRLCGTCLAQSASQPFENRNPRSNSRYDVASLPVLGKMFFYKTGERK